MTNPIRDRIAQQTTKSPAAPPAVYTPGAEQGYISMSIPKQRLAAPEISGYHCHWFMGLPDRIQQAMQAGYTWVDAGEVDLTNFDLAGDGRPIEGTDLGTRVSTVAGGLYEGTMQPQRLYLMKVPLWLWEIHQKELDAVNEKIAATLRGDKQLAFTAPSQDNTHRYRPEDELGKKKTLFHRKDGT